jgi:hypothetical protein
VEGQVLDVETVDLSYETYKKYNKSVNEACDKDFPGPDSNKSKKTRENYYRSVKRFKNWYRTGDGK